VHQVVAVDDDTSLSLRGISRSCGAHSLYPTHGGAPPTPDPARQESAARRRGLLRSADLCCSCLAGSGDVASAATGCPRERTDSLLREPDGVGYTAGSAWLTLDAAAVRSADWFGMGKQLRRQTGSPDRPTTNKVVSPIPIGICMFDRGCKMSRSTSTGSTQAAAPGQRRHPAHRVGAGLHRPSARGPLKTNLVTGNLGRFTP
jgi:hypothetical protein